MSNSTCNIELYSHPREFPSDVVALFSLAERADIESGAGWYANLVDTVFPQPGQALFYVLRSDGVVQAALPLVLASRYGGQELRALGNFYTSLWTPILAPSANVADLITLLRGVRTRHPRLIRLDLAPLDKTAASTRVLAEALRSSGFIQFGYFRFINWYLRVSSGWSAYLEQREGKLRSTLKRMSSKFKAQQGSLRIVTQGPDVEVALAEYLQVYSSSWKRPEPFPDFIPGLIRAAAERGCLRLGVARLDGKAVAAQIWLVHQGRASIFKLAYDEAYKSYSPGSLLTACMMEHAFEQDRVIEVDYLIGDDAYKRVWMSDSRERVGMLAFNKFSPLGLLGAMREWFAIVSKPLRAAIARHRSA